MLPNSTEAIIARNQMAQFMDDINSIKIDVALIKSGMQETRKEVAHLAHVIDGNGTTGLKTQVALNTEAIKNMVGETKLQRNIKYSAYVSIFLLALQELIHLVKGFAS